MPSYRDLLQQVKAEITEVDAPRGRLRFKILAVEAQPRGDLSTPKEGL